MGTADVHAPIPGHLPSLPRLDISIIIVSYNVRYFLDQCLRSVLQATTGLDAEVWVVDNNSRDNSVAHVQAHFPEVHLIANPDNPGFSRANNQAIALAQGRYILLLNPDTVVLPDALCLALAYLDQHPGVGGLGVKMFDGQGRYAPESKRGLPTLRVAAYKMLGLSALLPQHKHFGQYYMSYLSANETQEVEVLSGACMFIRKQVLDVIGGLDERFFMYGEDIDLSYRITQAGYRNVFFPAAQIVHYKGESTRKASVKYVYTFYRAMALFARKHFGSGRAYALLIETLIAVRVVLAVLHRLASAYGLVLLDAVVLFIGQFLLKRFWQHNSFTGDFIDYPEVYVHVVLPVYVSIWVACLWLFGAYDKPIHTRATFRGVVLGAATILGLYALLPEAYRFSRALVLLGSGFALVALPLLRIGLQALWKGQRPIGPAQLLVVGQADEAARVSSLLQQAGSSARYMGTVDPTGQNPNSLCNLADLPQAIAILNVTEVVFCARDVPPALQLQLQHAIGPHLAQFKTVAAQSDYIIGAHSVENPMDVFTLSFGAQIATPANRRNKRIFDLVMAVGLLLLFPVVLLRKGGAHALGQALQVLAGRKTWVGYANASGLPPIKKGVFTPRAGIGNANMPNAPIAKRMDALYAAYYEVRLDANRVWHWLRRGE